MILYNGDDAGLAYHLMMAIIKDTSYPNMGLSLIVSNDIIPPVTLKAEQGNSDVVNFASGFIQGVNVKEKL